MTEAETDRVSVIMYLTDTTRGVRVLECVHTDI